jgi:hypothetical protein
MVWRSGRSLPGEVVSHWWRNRKEAVMKAMTRKHSPLAWFIVGNLIICAGCGGVVCVVEQGEIVAWWLKQTVAFSLHKGSPPSDVVRWFAVWDIQPEKVKDGRITYYWVQIPKKYFSENGFLWVCIIIDGNDKVSEYEVKWHPESS